MSIRSSIIQSEEPTEAEIMLVRVGLAARLLQLLGRDLWTEALAVPPQQLTRESRIAINAVVAARLSDRSVDTALDNLRLLLSIPEEDIAWQSLGLVEGPEQSVVEARALTVGALVEYSTAILIEFRGTLDELIGKR
jgi:hypothetical protein